MSGCPFHTKPASTGLMARLKEETAERHQFAETRLLQKDMVSGKIARGDYGRWLVQMHAVHAALGRGLELTVAARPDVAELAQTNSGHVANLAADCRSFGMEPSDIDPDSVLEATRQIMADLDATAETNPLALLGSLYVLEGSMNGNRYIARKLTMAWADDGHDANAEPGLRYLTPYGESQRERWTTWRDRMDVMPFGDDEQTAMLHAAMRMFDGIAGISDALRPQD